MGGAGGGGGGVAEGGGGVGWGCGGGGRGGGGGQVVVAARGVRIGVSITVSRLTSNTLEFRLRACHLLSPIPTIMLTTEWPVFTDPQSG